MPVFLSNASLLTEIRKSKNSFCEYANPEDAEFDICIRDHLTDDELREWCKEFGKPNQVIRLTRDIHVPPQIERRARARRKNGHLPFEPYCHFRLDDDLQPTEILRSFWEGDFETGRYSPARGRITDQLGSYMMLLVQRLAKKPNFIGYSYRDEMESAAITQLTYAALLFTEETPRQGYQPNPFAYYTAVATNTFKRTLNQEKAIQVNKDRQLAEAGMTTSVHSQHGLQLNSAGSIEPTKIERKRGRRTTTSFHDWTIVKK